MPRRAHAICVSARWRPGRAARSQDRRLDARVKEIARRQIGYRVLGRPAPFVRICDQVQRILGLAKPLEYNRLGITDRTAGLLSRGSQVRVLPGAPTFAHACQRQRELRLAGQAKVQAILAHRSSEGAKAGRARRALNRALHPRLSEHRHSRDTRLVPEVRQPSNGSSVLGRAFADSPQHNVGVLSSDPPPQRQAAPRDTTRSCYPGLSRRCGHDRRRQPDSGVFSGIRSDDDLRFLCQRARRLRDQRC